MKGEGGSVNNILLNEYGGDNTHQMMSRKVSLKYDSGQNLLKNKKRSLATQPRNLSKEFNVNIRDGSPEADYPRIQSPKQINTQEKPKKVGRFAHS